MELRKIICIGDEKMTIEELQKIIIENFQKDGFIHINGLDFSDYYLDISGIKAKTIDQSEHTADIIWQKKHHTKRIYQNGHEADYIFQAEHDAKTIDQSQHKNAEYVYQCDIMADIIHQYGHTAKQIFQKNTAEYVGPYNPVYNSNRVITSGTYERAMKRTAKQANGWLTGKR